MNIGKQHQYARYRRITMLWAAALSLITAAGVFWSVSAGGEVSPTDLVSDSSVAAISVEDDSSARQSDDVIVGRITESTPDFIASAHKKKIRFIRSRFVNAAAYDGSFYSELTAEEKMIYDAYVEHFVENRQNESFTVSFDGSFTFDASSYDEEQDDLTDDSAFDGVRDLVISATAAFYYDHPEIFWIRKFYYGINYKIQDQVGHLTDIDIVYKDQAYSGAYEELEAVDAGLASAVQSVRNARASSSRYDTVLAIHDYICNHAQYDYTAANSSDYYQYGYAYTAAPLFTGKGIFVCEGYAKAFKMLCDAFDIPCVMVSGTGMVSKNYGGSHMWNYVQMEDDNWYGVDATWDDGTQVTYSYFLVGTDTEESDDMTFGKDHLPNPQVMTVDTINTLAYPFLSAKAYVPVAKRPESLSLTTLGASIRLKAPYGIRFGIQLDKNEAYEAVDIVQYGTLMIPTQTLGNSELTVDTPKAIVLPAANLYSEDSEQITYTGVLVGIPDSFFDKAIKGRGYLIYRDDDGKEHTIYSNVAEKSFYGVAEAAQKKYSALDHPTQAQKNALELLNEIMSKKH